jgi:hypothetical protein
MAIRDPLFSRTFFFSSDKCLPTWLPCYVNINSMHHRYLVQVEIKEHFEKMKKKIR